MLDIKQLRDDPDPVRRSIALRRLDPARVDLDRLLQIDAGWREHETRASTLRARRNELSAQIKTLTGEKRQSVIEQVKQLKGELAAIESALTELAAQRDELLRLMPNLLGDDVPEGGTDEDNVELSRWGEHPRLDFEPRDHLELGLLTDTLDFDRAAKVTGAAFYYLKREAVLLEQALLGLAASRLSAAGFVPMTTPDIARAEILEGIGFAPRGPEKQVYALDEGDLCLVGTAEITVGGYHSDEILSGSELPLRYLGFSHCFRTEAGAHGRESRGLYRVHQFSKAEMFVLCHPDESARLHEQMRELEEALLRELGIPYRVVNVCAGDLGAPAAKKYDIEAWMPGRGRYGEVTSCSNCTDYQARRLNIRFRDEPTSPTRFVHMLNGTAVAISRTLIALYENYQQQDGSILIPQALHPWMGPIDRIPCRR